MDNMYDILAKMTLLEGRAKKEPKETKEEKVEESFLPGFDEAVDPEAFAKLAPPRDKITFADKIAGAKKEVDEMLGDVAAEAMKKAVVGLKDEQGMEEAAGQVQHPFPVKQTPGGIFVDNRSIAQELTKKAAQLKSKPQGMMGKMLRPGVATAQDDTAGVYQWLAKAFNQSEIEGAQLVNMIMTSPNPEYSRYRDAFDSLVMDLKKSGIDLQAAAKAALNPGKYFQNGTKPAMAEDDMEEGNDFTGARLAAIRAGKPTFTVAGKTYKVTGDTSDEKMMEKKEKTLWPGTPEYKAKFGEPGMKTGEKKRSSTGGEIEKTATGIKHTAKAYDDEEETKADDGAPKRRGRPKGSKRALGAKGPTGNSKLLKKGAIKQEESVSEAEGDEVEKAMALLKKHGYEVKKAEGKEVDERKLTKPEMKKREEFVKSMKKSKGDFEKRYGKRGEEVMYATATKMAKKKAEESKDKEEVEETTTSGSVATAPAEAPKGKKGMMFGKGVYEGKLEESYKSRLEQMLTEGMSMNMSQGEDGSKSLSVTATDDDAIKLAQILQLAGMEQGKDYHDVCSGCGQQPCGCEGMAEGEYANSPEQEYADTDTMVNTLSGGLNGRKTTGQTTLPVINRDPARQGVGAVAEEILEQQQTRLWDLYKRYEGQ